MTSQEDGKVAHPDFVIKVAEAVANNTEDKIIPPRIVIELIAMVVVPGHAEAIIEKAQAQQSANTEASNTTS